MPKKPRQIDWAALSQIGETAADIATTASEIAVVMQALRKTRLAEVEEELESPSPKCAQTVELLVENILGSTDPATRFNLKIKELSARSPGGPVDLLRKLINEYASELIEATGDAYAIMDHWTSIDVAVARGDYAHAAEAADKIANRIALASDLH